MKIQKKNLILGALALAAALGSMASQAATKMQCANLAKPAGYLTVETGIPGPGCKGTNLMNKYQTPSEGLTILSYIQLTELSEPWAVKRIDGIAPNLRYVIGKVQNGFQFCTIQNAPYNFVAAPNGLMAGCGNAINGENSVKLYKIFTPSVTTVGSGKTAVRVVMNPAINDNYNYAIRTTATLNGASTTVVKTGLSGSEYHRLRDIAPDLVKQAEQGASFSFQIDMFSGLTKVADEAVTAPSVVP